MTTSVASALVERVRRGVGLVLVGGDSARALQTYVDTPLHDLLPVDPVPRPLEPKRRLELAIAIDRSGSMADAAGAVGSKLELALSGATQLASGALAPGDRLGILTFDAAAQWHLPMGLATVAAIARPLHDVGAGGRTNLETALIAAGRAFGRSEARRHVVVISDGATSGEPVRAAADLADREITVSTIGVGFLGPGERVLRRIATAGGGAFAAAREPERIPDFIRRETDRVLERRAVVDGEIELRIAAPHHPAMTGLADEALPVLARYVPAELRDGAAKLVSTGPQHGFDPIVAARSHGLGQVVVWTTGLAAGWTQTAIDWPRFGPLWTQIAKWAAGGADPIEVRYVVRHIERQLVIELVSRHFLGRAAADFELALISVDGALPSLALASAGDGRLRAQFDPPAAGGTYRLAVRHRDRTGPFVRLHVPAVRTQTTPAPRERPGPVDVSCLREIAQLSGGVVGDITQMHAGAAPPRRITTALWPWAIACMLVLLLLETAARRL